VREPRATEIRAYAADFAQLIRDVPEPRVFSDLDQKIRVAEADNRQFNGMYAPVIAQLQTQLAHAHRRAVTAYAAFSARSAPYDATPGATGADDTIVGDPKPGSPDIDLVDNTLAPHPGQPVPHRRHRHRRHHPLRGPRLTDADMTAAVLTALAFSIPLGL
jgi:hypothetical protein